MKKDSRNINASENNRVSRSERFGQWSETIARGMGTPTFLVQLTLFCALWITWNTLAPEKWRFDSAAIGFTALTLILSLQASYAAPMILLAQNRQDDRDRVHIEQDRQRAERNLADTEFMAREVVALRLALKDLPDREWLRAEIKSLLEEINEDAAQEAAAAAKSTSEDPAAPDASALNNTQVRNTAVSDIQQNPLTGRFEIATKTDTNRVE